MKPLERDINILLAMADRMLVEHMIRLWMSRMPDTRHSEDKAKQTYASFCQEMFSFDVSTGQVAYFYEGGFNLAGFATWWRIGPETLAAFKDAAGNGINLGGFIPPDPRIVMHRKPEMVYVRALVTKPERPTLAGALVRAIKEANLDCVKGIWWDRRSNGLKDWSGN